MAEQQNVGTIVEIKGVVIDAVFPDELPEILTALEIQVPAARTALRRSSRRSSSTSATTGCAPWRWTPRTASRAARTSSTPGQPITVPVGAPTLGRLWNVIGEPIDEKEAPAERRALADPPRPAGLPRPLAQDGDLRDGPQGRRPDRAVHQGRQGRPLRRRRRRQDGPDPGADPQRRESSTAACPSSPVSASGRARATTCCSR